MYIYNFITIKITKITVKNILNQYVYKNILFICTNVDKKVSEKFI